MRQFHTRLDFVINRIGNETRKECNAIGGQRYSFKVHVFTFHFWTIWKHSIQQKVIGINCGSFNILVEDFPHFPGYDHLTVVAVTQTPTKTSPPQKCAEIS